MLLHRSDNVQFFAYRPQHDFGRNSAYGLTLRVRRGRIWRHLTIRLHSRSRPLDNADARGCWTYEVVTWRSGPKMHQRVSVKAFVRLKVGLGGERVA